jgi:hypothetical protein
MISFAIITTILECLNSNIAKLRIHPTKTFEGKMFQPIFKAKNIKEAYFSLFRLAHHPKAWTSPRPHIETDENLHMKFYAFSFEILRVFRRGLAFSIKCRSILWEF